jgi:hypothetical protein
METNADKTHIHGSVPVTGALDEKLCTRQNVFRDDLFAGKVIRVFGGGKRRGAPAMKRPQIVDAKGTDARRASQVHKGGF